MKKPGTVLTKKTVFFYKSLKTAYRDNTKNSTDPFTTTATMTMSSTACIAP